MTHLSDLVAPLKRAVAVPGEFVGTFANTTDNDLTAVLLDAFAESQLFGFFGPNTSTDDGIVTPDLSRGEGALVVIFAMCRVLSSEIRNRKTHVKYEAKGTIFEQDSSATMLVQLLKDYSEQKKELLSRSVVSAGNAFFMADQYFLRAVGYPSGYSSNFLLDGEWFNYGSSVGPI